MLLSAIEELDFAARLRGRQAGERESASVGEIIAQLAEDWASQAVSRAVQLRIAPRASQLQSALDRELASRLLKRFISALIDSSAAGEMVHVEAEEARGRLSIIASRPAATMHLGESQMFDPAYSSGVEGEGTRLGLGFALRLVRGLARLAGGDLRLSPSDLTLILPLARG